MNDRYDLSTPRLRREALRLVSLDDPVPDHALLRQIFDSELAWRESSEEGVGDEFGNIYLCAFLLFVIGDPADSPRLYRAKFGTGDFDLATGFDAQAIFGAGRNETLQWLQTNGFAKEEAQMTEWLARWEHPTARNGPSSDASTSTHPPVSFVSIRCDRAFATQSRQRTHLPPRARAVRERWSGRIAGVERARDHPAIRPRGRVNIRRARRAAGLRHCRTRLRLGAPDLQPQLGEQKPRSGD